MKTFTKILALALVVVMSVVMLVSCSTYGKIQSAFEDAGYTLQNPDNEKTGTIKTDDGEITYTIHTFQKEAEDSDSILGDIIGGIGEAASTAIVWEFASDKDLAAAIEESETLKGMIEDAQNSDFVNGNCVLTTVNSEAVDIFKSTK